MTFSYISYLDYYKPCNHLTASEVVDKVTDSQKNKNYILKYSNLNEIAVELQYNQFDMYNEIMEKYIISNDPSEIRYVIFTGDDYFTNSKMSVPYYLVGKYGFKNASIITLNQACTGTPQAIHLADNIIKSNPDVKVMIISLSKKLSLEERYDWPTIIGDGAGLMVLGNQGFLKILDCNSWSDGSASLKRYNNDENEDLINRENLNMLDLKKVIIDLLIRNNISVNDIHKFIPQSNHHLLYRMYSKILNVELEKFFVDNIPYGGHLGDVDSIRNLKDTLTKYNQSSSLKYLLFTVGNLSRNYSYHAVLIESC